MSGRPQSPHENIPWMKAQRTEGEHDDLAGEFIAWVEKYASKVCPEGCLPTPAQEREIELFARVTRALRGLKP